MLQLEVSQKVQIDLYSHHFVVRQLDERTRRAISDFTRDLVEWGLRRIPPYQGRPKFERTMIRIYGSATRDRKEFRFHINQWPRFEQCLTAAGLLDDERMIIQHPLYCPAPAPLEIICPHTPRDYQLPLIEYFSNPEGPRSRVVTLQTGKGKGLVACSAIGRWSVRTAIVVKAEYLEKWQEEVEGFFKLGKDDLYVIQGSKALISLMHLALEGTLKAKLLIISNKTFQNYLKDYETHYNQPERLYPIAPDDFYEVLQVGIRLIDEVHQDFHLNFKQDTYTHIPLTMALSATLDSDNPLLNKMYQLMWPVETRGPDVPYDRYIAATCMWYQAYTPDRLKHKNGQGQYSHTEFEKSILRHVGTLKNYLKMLCDITARTYVEHRVEGQKMLIFCSTIAMCSELTRTLKQTFPQLKISRYVGEDEWENLHNADIVVSTIQSAGTAVDIANLRYTLMTVALSNKQTNIQVLGRLRRLKDFPDVTPEFMFLSCRDIPKHNEYAYAKRDKLDGKVLTFSQLFLSNRI